MSYCTPLRSEEPVDRQIDILDDWPLFHLRTAPARRVAHVAGNQLDHEADLWAAAAVRNDADVFQADEGSEDLTRVAKDEGAS